MVKASEAATDAAAAAAAAAEAAAAAAEESASEYILYPSPLVNSTSSMLIDRFAHTYVRADKAHKPFLVFQLR